MECSNILPRQIRHFLLGWYSYLLQDKGGAWETFEDGSTSAKREPIVFQDKKVNFIFKEKSLFWPHPLEERIAVDPENIEAIKICSFLNNVSEVISFMRLARYYRIFFAGFSKVENPITSLQNKGNFFECTAKCEESFQHLKELMTIALILKVVNPYEDVVVYTDSCKEGIGGVLT